MVRMLFEAYIGWDTVNFLLHRNDTINQSDLLKFYWAVEALKQEKPIQQIIGYVEFCNCCIAVSPDVLIPRPETEEIVQYTQQLLQNCLRHSGQELDNATFNIQALSLNENPLRILDLCTGSGCIAVALAKMFPKAKVFGVDISPDALAVAQENAKQNNVVVEFLQHDLLSAISSTASEFLQEATFDLIISNPPYIQRSAKSSMHRNVLNYEPELALFVEDCDPLIFYRQICIYAKEHLTPQGYLIVEINDLLGAETLQLFQLFGFKATLHQDFNGRDRMIVASNV